MLTLICVLSACSAQRAEGELELRACIGAEPASLDPTFISTVDEAAYAYHLFEPLMKYQAGSEPAGEDPDVLLAAVSPGQAASYEVSEDGLVYTFTLRDSLWSDGQPVQAADFVYAWQRLVDPAVDAPYGYLLEQVVLNAASIRAGELDKAELGIKALDEQTLEITLAARTPAFLQLCAFAALAPLRQDVIEANGDWTLPEIMVTNGAYTLSEWKHGAYIKMAADPAYYEAESIGPRQLTWYLKSSAENILSAYQSGKYDFITSFPAEQTAALLDSGDCHFLPYTGTGFLYLSCRQLPDWRVRAALALAIDRDSLVQEVLMSGQAADGLVPSGLHDSSGADFRTTGGEVLYQGLATLFPEADFSTYDGCCAVAKTLLEQAKASGFDAAAPIVYIFPRSDSLQAVAEAVQAEVKAALGLTLTLAPQDWSQYSAALAEDSFGLAAVGWNADYDDALSYLRMFATGSFYNYGEWSNADYDVLIAAAKTLPAGEERDQYLYRAAKMMYAENGFPNLPLYYYTNKYCLQNGFSQVEYNPFGYFFLGHAHYQASAEP